jgi:uncharacterized protein
MRDRILKVVYIVSGIICVILAFIGIFLPVLPTTPFLLLAAFFFARSSDRFLHWLLTNRWFGPYIRNYREGKGMTARNKAFTLTMLWISIGIAAIYAVSALWLRVILFGIASGVTFHLARINTYHPEE